MPPARSRAARSGGLSCGPSTPRARCLGCVFQLYSPLLQIELPNAVDDNSCTTGPGSASSHPAIMFSIGSVA
eukprot:10792621-Alexandrium_andersonii.AAC.1